MPSEATRRVLYVFIASPSDLAQERSAAYEVTKELNQVIGRRLNLQIELLGWEDTLPRYSRPQEIINKDVDVCDLFIGLLWRRWGTPTGQYLSGFEEEFTLARRRRAAAQRPEIWLLFKYVEPALAEDPGEELRRVLAFRETQVAAKELLFKEFTNIDDFKAKLRNWLLSYALDQAPQFLQPIPLPPAEKTSEAQPPAPEHATPAESDVTTQPIQSQLAEVLTVLNRGIGAGSLEFGRQDREPIDRFVIARLYLLAATLMSRESPTKLLGTHELNLIYQYRDRIHLAPREQSVVIRTLIADRYDLLPGWYWFRDMDFTQLILSLFHHAAQDRNEDVRERAVQLMISGRFVLPGGFPPRGALLRMMLTDRLDAVRKATLSYLAATGTTDDVPLVEPLLNDDDSDVRSEAIITRLVIIARSSHPNDAMTVLMGAAEAGSRAIVAEMERRKSEIRTDNLLRALHHPNERLRIFAIEALSQRGEFSPAIAEPLLKDPSVLVREASYRQLIHQGVVFSPREIREALKGSEGHAPTLLGGILGPRVDPDELVLTAYRQLSAEELVAEVDWFSLDGPIAYRALGLQYFDTANDRIRSDLSDRFGSLRERSLQQFRTKYGALPQDVLQKFSADEIDNYVRGKYIAAAMAVLSERGDSSDLQVARTILTEYGAVVHLEAIRLLERLGDVSDASTLFEIARTTHGRVQREAARVALKLAPGVDGVVRQLLDSGEPHLLRAGLRSLLNEDFARVGEMVERLLIAKGHQIREAALSYLLRRCSEEDLESLLGRYLEQETYYYNIACWLDRVLYAPRAIKEMYRRQLGVKLEDGANDA